MGLDVYVGPLSRYYTGQWETIVEQYARQSGMQVRVVRPGQSRGGIIARLLAWLRPAPNVHHAVARWQAELSRLIGTSVAWNDDEEREYFTDKPAWDSYGALLLWAAYEEHGATKLPETADGWSANPIVKAASEDLESKYAQILSGVEVWIPVDFERPVIVETLTGGSDVVVGSIPQLVRQLDALNRATWNADDETISAWRHDGAGADAPLVNSAQFGFAVMSQLAALAAQHRLPMKLDY